MPGTSTYARKAARRASCSVCHQQRLLQNGLCTTCVADRYRDLDAGCYLDRPEFQDYAAAVELVIFRARDEHVATHGSNPPFPGLCTREIHDALGDRARRDWTMAAVSNNSSIRLIEGLIDRWRPATGSAPKFSRRWNNQSMNFLFPQRRKAAASPVDPPRERALT